MSWQGGGGGLRSGRRMDRWRRVVLAWAAPLGLFAGAASVAGCTPHIGDHCVQNTDCSIQGNLQCDTSQPNGYCTLFSCTPNVCQDNAACVAINPDVPGCPYDDYQSPSRTSIDMCLKSCGKDSDCRTGEGYVCRDPRNPPWNAQVVDTQFQRVCLPLPAYDVGALAASDGAPPICLAAGPLLDGAVFAEQDATGESGPATADAGGAQDAGFDGAADAIGADAASGD